MDMTDCLRAYACMQADMRMSICIINCPWCLSLCCVAECAFAEQLRCITERPQQACSHVCIAHFYYCTMYMCIICLYHMPELSMCACMCLGRDGAEPMDRDSPGSARTGPSSSQGTTPVANTHRRTSYPGTGTGPGPSSLGLPPKPAKQMSQTGGQMAAVQPEQQKRLVAPEADLKR